MTTYATSSQVLTALGDPTRQAIVELLHGGPCSVGELAHQLPVSRPAVSQHLRVLKSARLVRDEAVGTRRLYRLDPAGAEALRTYYEAFWAAALSAFREHVERGKEKIMSQAASSRPPTLGLAPVVASVEVDASPARAFERFTTELGAWWPLATHSIAADEELEVKPVGARIEPGVGGRIVETWSDGQEIGWGHVLAWEPPQRLVLAWNPTRTRTVTTEVEITFSPRPGGTLVRLEHRCWERLGDRAATIRSGYEVGWPHVLGRLAMYQPAG